MLLAHVADRIFGRPLLIAPEKAEVILAVLGARIGIGEGESDLGRLIDGRPELSSFAGKPANEGRYRLDKHGIAIVPVLGTLVNRGAWIGPVSGMTSYEGLTEQLKAARKDPNVRGILLDIDSPGGEAGGAFELPDLIREVRKVKPVWAHVNAMALSGGYLIASAAERITTVSTGLTGSIGVVMVHMDRLGEHEKAGRKPTLIFSGQKKADGHGLGPLPAEVKKRIQAELDEVREMFVRSVVAGRPKLEPEAVKATEAGVYMGRSAIEAGLADAIGTFDQVLEVMSKSLSRLIAAPAGYQTKLETQMTVVADAPAPAGADKASLDRARADGLAEGEQKGIASERSRIAGILASEEAKGRGDLAAHLAFETNTDAAAAKAMLAKSPKAEARPAAEQPAAKNQLAAKLYDAVAAAGGNPRIGHADDGAGGSGGGVSDKAYKSTLGERMDARIARMSKKKGA